MPATVASSLLVMGGSGSSMWWALISSGWLTGRINPRWLLGSYYALRGPLLMFLPPMMGPTVQLPLISFVVLFGPSRNPTAAAGPKHSDDMRTTALASLADT